MTMAPETEPLDVLTIGEMAVDFISFTTATPDFEEFRSGDYLRRPEEISEEAVAHARVVHASTFALSREPCRSAVIGAFRKAREMDKIVSLDPNYSRRVWPNYIEARGSSAMPTATST